MLDVEEVVMKLLEHVVEFDHMPLVDLRPARNPRTDDVAIAVERQGRLVPFGKRDCFRPGPDPAHFAAQDVDDLRQLVDAGLAEERAEPRDALVALRGHAGDPRLVAFRRLRHMRHGPELEDPEPLATKADALLSKQRRPRAVEADGDGDDEQ